MKRTGYAPLAVALFLPAFAGGQEGVLLPERTDNAPLHYWKAVALLARPGSAEEIHASELIEGDLQELPPRALADDRHAQAVLERDRGAVRALHEGGLKSRCNFDLDYEKGPALELPHLAQMRRLARRALAAAKLHQLRRSPESAAEIYGDLVRLAYHLDEDRLVMSGLVGAAIVRMTTSEIEGFFAREPSKDAMEIVFGSLEQLSARPFHLAQYVRVEARTFGEYVAAHPSEALRELKPAFHERTAAALERLDQNELGEKFRAWAAGYESQMNELARALEEPYWKARPRFDEIQAQAEAQGEALKTDGGVGNPLVACLVLALVRVPDELAKAEARLAMSRIACASMLAKAKGGACPADLDELRPYFRRGLPKDPFTGKDLSYRLEEGLPRVECAEPKRKEGFCWSIAKRRRRDEAPPELDEEDEF